MIRSLEARGFKVFAETTVSLARLTICTGGAGTGKSTLLEALAVLAEGATSIVDSTSAYLSSSNMGILRGKRSIGVEDPIVLVAELDQGGLQGELRMFEERSGAKLTKSNESLGFECSSVSLDPRVVIEPSADVAVPSIDSDGRGVASALACLAERRSPLLDEIDRDVRRIVPWAARVSTTREAMKTGLRRSILVETVTGETFGLAQAGDGLCLVVALLTVLCTAPTGRTILVEDLGHGLDRSAAHALMEVLRNVIDARPDLQVIATTTSTAIAEGVDPKDVRLFTLDARQRARVTTG